MDIKEEQKKKIQLQPKTLPLFADEVLVQSGIKWNPDKKAKFRKDGFIRLAFLDMRTRSVISDIVLSPITAENLAGILGKQMEKLDREMKSSKMPVFPKSAVPTSTQSYIG